MPDIRISELNPVTALVATDELPIVQGVGSTPVTKQITGQQLADGIVTLKGLASTSYVDTVVNTVVNTAVSNLIDGAPAILNTLKELADAIGDDNNFITTINNSIATKLSASSFNATANEWFKTTSTRNLYEDTNLYFTTARAQAAATSAISVGTPGAATGGGALSYNNGVFTFTPAATYTLPIASNSTLGGVKVDGTTITINNGVISGANTYTLPIASNSTLGGVKVDGTTITISNGVISSIGGGGSSTWANITDINNSNGPTHIAIGQNAGETGGGYGSAGANSIAIGTNSGSQNQGISAVSIGSNAGKLSQQGASIAIGNAAGFDSQGSQSIAGGWMAGYDHQGANAVAIGTGAGKITQGTATVAIGWNAGETNQGANAIAIGDEAGSSNQHANSIVINASGTALDSTDAGLYINPIRSADATVNSMYYNTNTNEVTYGPVPSGSSGSGGGLMSRATVSTTTSSIASGNSVYATVTGAKGYALYSIEVSSAAWVTVYSSTSTRSADSSRAITTDPLPGSGVLAEVISTGATKQYFTPAIIGFSSEASPSTNIQLKIYNNGGSASAITVTLTYLTLEV